MADTKRPGRSALEELAARHADTGALGHLRTAAGFGETADDTVPAAAAYGTQTYFADLHTPRGDRHVRVCAGTACFLASGGRHIDQVEQALGVRAGERAADGSVSLQAVHCLGFCYGGPAALDGDTPLAGADLAGQLCGRAPRRTPPVPAASVAGPVLLSGPTGWRVWPQLVGRADAPDVIRQQVTRSGLRGRGGAGFPAVRKWQAVAAEPGPRHVVANGDEGDPGSYADRLLMETAPDRVLEGLALAGLACGATTGVVYVRSEYPQALVCMREAVTRARAAGHLGRGVHGSGVDFDVEVAEGAGSYVAGEETSLLRSLAGLRGTVRLRPPYPVQYGLFGRPTAVNNVETLAAVPAIIAGGGDAYARLGREPETGTLLVCLNERFVRPGAYEVEPGTPLSEIVYGLGGGLPSGRTLRAVQVGGPLGGFLPPGRLALPLLASALDSAGVALGHGGIVAVDDTVPADALLAHLWRFYAAESCGACTPCREGTRRGTADPQAASADQDLLTLMATASLCPFGRSIPRAVRSLICALAEDPP